MLAATRSLRSQWSSTLCIPKSEFPVRPNPASTATYLKRCTDELYAWQQCNRPSAHAHGSQPEKFVLHDGPPYANGPLHIGHALNKITKDILCRFELSQGKLVKYVPGWDCHGLPIEIRALQGLPSSSRHNAVSVRATARELATRTIAEQRSGFKKWGIIGDWENAYKTMDAEFEIRQLEVFRLMFEKGLIYRQCKPVYWSPSSATALAEAELEYDDKFVSTAAFVKYPVDCHKQRFPLTLPGVKTLSLLIWTTTPWTLPANKAIGVHQRMEYAIVRDPEVPEAGLVVATSRIAHLESLLGRPLEVLDRLSGAAIAGNLTYENPFQTGGHQLVLHAEFVSDSSGSGLVHMAPGHGMDDYAICSTHSIAPFAPVDGEGRFTSEASPNDPGLLQGLPVQTEGTKAVLAFLGSQRRVLLQHPITHKYPVDWRLKQPVIVRATEQWFANVDSIKTRAMEALADVNFVPNSGRSRLEAFIQDRNQWCISRQRAWGVPIPALYQVVEGQRLAVMDSATITHIISVIQERGTEAWWSDAPNDPAWIPGHLKGDYVRAQDTLDVWFDSGTSWTCLEERNGNPVADVYIEGTDQHRGWFQSSLLTHVARGIKAHDAALSKATAVESRTQAPFKTLITHGFVLDHGGRKMSKSVGNVISPDQIMSGVLLPPLKRRKQNRAETPQEARGSRPVYDAMGLDALRLWVASNDFTKDITVGQPILQSVNLTLQKYRVTFRWLLGVLCLKNTPSTFTDLRSLGSSMERQNVLFQKPQPGNDSELPAIDQVALHGLMEVSKKVHAYYRTYEFSRAVAALNKYFWHDLSAFYFETLKDRIYAGAIHDRIGAQQTLGMIFYEVCQMLAPICPLLVEEVWDWLPGHLKQHTPHPARETWTPFKCAACAPWVVEWKKGLEVAGAAVKAAQERLRQAKKMGSSLECDVWLSVPEHMRSHLFYNTRQMDARAVPEGREDELAAMLVLSRVRVFVQKADTCSWERVLEEEKPEWHAIEHFDVEVTTTAPSSPTDCGATVQRSATSIVVPPRGCKCPRCWRYVAAAPVTLCTRCSRVVKEQAGGSDKR